MFNNIRQFIAGSGFIKTSFYTGISTSVKIITSFFINKVIAVYIGPSGLAVIGNFQNFLLMMTTASTGAIESGIVKYAAEHHDDPDRRRKILGTGLKITLSCSLFLSAALIFFHQVLSVQIMHSVAYAPVFLLLGFAMVFSALNIFILAVLNGHKEIRKYVAVNIISSLAGLALAFVLVYYRGIAGALYSLIVNQAAAVVFSLFFVFRSTKVRRDFFFSSFDKESAAKLFKFSAMAITTAFTGPAALMLVRNYIGETLSWDDAGYWEGVLRISNVYLLLITTSISIYYLPRMSELKSNSEMRKELIHTYKIALPVVLIIALAIFLLKDFIILLLFSEAFLPMKQLFNFQLIGDFLKITAWLLSYLMVAKAMTKVYIATEIIFNATFVGLALFFVREFGIIGVTYAYAFNYFIYAIAMAVIFRGIINGK